MGSAKPAFVLWALCLMLMVGCREGPSGTGTPPPASPGTPDMRGTITHIRLANQEEAQQGTVGFLLVEGDWASRPTLSMVDVRVVQETAIRAADGGERLDFRQLVIGQGVEVAFAGTPEPSDPPLATAAEIWVME